MMLLVLRTLLENTRMYFKLNLVSSSAIIIYFSGTMLLFYGSWKILWIFLTVYISINIVCGGLVWYRGSPIKVNHSGTIITNAIIVWGWLRPVALYMFLYTVNTLAHNNHLKILWSKQKSRKEYYIISFLQIS